MHVGKQGCNGSPEQHCLLQTKQTAPSRSRNFAACTMQWHIHAALTRSYVPGRVSIASWAPPTASMIAWPLPLPSTIKHAVLDASTMPCSKRNSRMKGILKFNSSVIGWMSIPADQEKDLSTSCGQFGLARGAMGPCVLQANMP